MKKVIALAMSAAILILSLSACDGNTAAETTAQETQAVTEAPASTDTEAALTDASTEEATDGADTTVTEGITTAEETDDPMYDYPRAPEDVRIDYADESLYCVLDPETGEEIVYGNPDATKLKPGKSRAVKFTVEEDAWVSFITVHCHSMMDNTGTLLFEVYKWTEVERTDDADEKEWLAACYDNTVGSTTPLITKVCTDYVDNSILDVTLEDDLDMTMADGTYLFVVSNPDEEDLGVGVYTKRLRLDSLHPENNFFLSDIVQFANGNVLTQGFMWADVGITYIYSD